jgi:transposase
MPRPVRARRPLAIAGLVIVATVAAGLIGELAVRLFVPPAEPLGRLSYAMLDGTEVTDVGRAAELGFIAAVPGKVPDELPRPRAAFAPGRSFYLRYSDQDRLRRPWLDSAGRVLVRINQHGVRERDELPLQKPPGERRIVCIGDSFTFGWGIPEEQNWVRLLEDALRQQGQDVRTINCGAAGTVCIDEYVVGLQRRFHQFGPDQVILTICLNDLIPSSGLSLIDPLKTSGSRLVDLARGVFGRSPLDLDPDRDWVQELLDLPANQALAAGYCHPADKPAEAMWSTGVPKKYLRECKAWCEDREVAFLVVLWPFLQGLGEGRHYPFQKLHDLVAAECRAAGIAFVDALPALRSTPDEDLWVTPGDMHPNPRAQRLALTAILPAVQAQK